MPALVSQVFLKRHIKTVLNTNMGALYSPSLSAQVVDGACYLINYELDLNSPENANAATNGYLTATISVADEITKDSQSFIMCQIRPAYFRMRYL